MDVFDPLEVDFVPGEKYDSNFTFTYGHSISPAPFVEDVFFFSVYFIFFVNLKILYG